MSEEDVPSPIDFHELAQAREWETQTILKRPWRPQFFAAFVATLNSRFDREFSVLELGSGPGHLAEQFLRDCKVARYVALDFSQSMHHWPAQGLAHSWTRPSFCNGISVRLIGLPGSRISTPS
jgi:hypothetical protein